MSSKTKNRTGKVKKYFRGVKAEMKKVVWPTRKELVNYTGVVILISGLIAITVAVLDIVIQNALSLIIG